MSLDLVLSYWLVLLIVLAVAELIEGRGARLASARRRWPANLALIAISSGLASFVPLTGFTAAHWAQDASFGGLNWLRLPVALDILAGLLTLSLWGWAFHLAAHKVPLLWRFHKVHHSDVELDATTTFRTHPVIHILNGVLSAVVVVALGVAPAAVIGYLAVVLVIDLSHHTTLLIPDRLDRALRPWLMTPRLHHIHHSDLAAETDSNYGHDLALWDRLFGTYRTAPDRGEEAFRLGLTQYPPDRANDLHALLAAPFRRDPNA